MPTRQEVANELNKLQSSGATEQQIVDYVAKSGYNPDDFNVDMNGSFRPMTIGTGTVTQNYTVAELKESNQYYDNLASSASVTTKPATATVTGTIRTTTVTETQTTTFQQSTGGGSTTVYSTPATDTPTSLSYKQEAKTASDLQSSYALNPDSKFGKSALDRRLADGRITQEQYNDIVSSTPEQRREKSLEYAKQYEDARTKEIAAQEGGQPVVAVTTQPNTSEVSTTYNKTVTSEVTKVNGDVPGSSNISVQTVDGVEYQVVTNEDGTSSYTAVDSPYGEDQTFTENPDVLTEPPGTEIDEFGNLDAQIAANENALQEPPLLSDEEANDYLQQAYDEQIDYSQPDDIADGSDPGVYFENNGEESISQTFYENDGTPSYAAAQGLSSSEQNTRSQATQQDVANFKQKEDWRVRLSLAPGATYLYNDKQNAGILAPLQATDGVIFPYTPTINVNYAAAYEPTELTHSNYKIFQYKSSSVDNVQITCEFTAQDTFEANYLLAVIHFFRSVTKMFYGQDQNPKPGTPPPLCYLSGLGAFQFDAHPLAITAFNYSLPNDVDYIRAGSVTTPAGVNQAPSNPAKSGFLSSVMNRLSGANLNPGGLAAPPQFRSTQFGGTKEPTYVPTKMQITVTAIPIVTRNDISNKFSLREYGSGALLRGTKRQGGGIW